MALLPKLGIAGQVDRALLESQKERGRGYLGFSQIGDPCTRKVWYEMMHPMKIDDARLLRIFDVGNLFEDYIVSLLRKAGLTVYDKDENGKQFQASLMDGKIQGHCDGVVVGLPESNEPHLLEIKSAKNSSFKQFVKDGLYKTSLRYYGQMQLYMHAFNLSRGLFVVMNKDTQELYFERVKYDKIEAQSLLEIAKHVICSDFPPERAYPKKTFYMCKMCRYNEFCWEGKL